jgi:NADP-dependent 3-hydroxy acid dehydrogenase YdfG
LIQDKVVVITGASSGIGHSTAKALAKKGAKIVAGARRLDRLETLKKEITDDGGEITICETDVTKKTDCDNLVKQALDKYGTVDVLVNNAGLMPLSFVKSLKVDEWDRMIDVNIKGVLYCTAAVVPTMTEKKSGHIINISSVAGRIVFPAGSVYCATKHAVTAFSEGLRQELSVRKNIRVTSIEPGVVQTELTNTITEDSLQGFIEKGKQMEALQADDISNAIIFAIDAPNHMNVNEILIRPTTQDH